MKFLVLNQTSNEEIKPNCAYCSGFCELPPRCLELATI